MATARKLDAALQVTPYFHCTSRCVRGAFLCGINKNTGQDFTHRRRWLRARLLKLATVFSIELAAFAIMENHFHVVLKVDLEAIKTRSDREIIERWHQIFKGTDNSRRYIEGGKLTPAEIESLSLSVNRWRNDLTDISWFMRCAKEPLARSANQEDGCKGRFWEGRFHSQVLLDKQALIACMTYVDLNPLRAKMSEHPESDPFTSLHYRAEAISAEREPSKPLPPGLLNIDAHDKPTLTPSFPVSTLDYIELVDLAARQQRPGKPGSTASSTKPLLERLGISKPSWQNLQIYFKEHFHALVGSSDSMTNACNMMGKKRIWGQRHCRNFFDGPATG